MKSQDKTNSRLGWTLQQEMLKRLYENEGLKSWKIISEKINQTFEDKNWTAKQCRERYINYIKFQQKQSQKKDWNAQDDMILFEKYREVGSKWTVIRQVFSGKSQNFLKNKFYGALRKVHRRINRIEKQNNLKKHKPIKFDSILKILQSTVLTDTNSQIQTLQKIQYRQFVQCLKQKILKSAIQSQKSNSSQVILEIILQVHKFNVYTKFFNIIRQRKCKTLKRRNLPPIYSPQSKQLTSSIQIEEKKQKSTQEVQPSLKKMRDMFQISSQIQKQFGNIFASLQSSFTTKINQRDLEQQVREILKGGIEENHF